MGLGRWGCKLWGPPVRRRAQEGQRALNWKSTSLSQFSKANLRSGLAFPNIQVLRVI